MLLSCELTEKKTYTGSEQDTDGNSSSGGGGGGIGDSNKSGDDENSDNLLLPGAQHQEVSGDSASSSGPFLWEDMQKYSGKK